jgi:hypothetical protein
MNLKMKEKIKKIYSPLILISLLIPIFSFAQTSLKNEFVGILAVNGALRDCPSLDCSIIRYYAETTEVKIIGLDNSSDWYKVIAHDDDGKELNGWMHYSLFIDDFKNYFLSSSINQKLSTGTALTGEQKEDNPLNKFNLFGIFSKNINLYRGLLIAFIIFFSVFLFKKYVKRISRVKLKEFRSKLEEISLPKIKFKQKNLPISLFIALAIILGFMGMGYGAVYYQTSKVIENAKQLTNEEKYDEALDKLNLAQVSWTVQKLAVNKQKISDEIDKNKQLSEDESKYNKGLDELNKGNLQGSIDSLLELPENSFYYQKAQTKIEEAKRKMVEGKLSEEQVARKGAEARAKQEEFEKKLKEEQLASKEAEEKMMNADNDGDSLTYRREKELGTSDFNKDSDFDGIPDNLDSHPAGGGRNIPQTFAWSYGGYNWTWTESIQEDWYDYYKAKPRGSLRSTDFITSDDPFIKKISERIIGGEKPDVNRVWLAVSFVQNLPYVDDVYTGYDEYPKYPVETFFEKNGDCEDSSYLAASIIHAMNRGVVLILLPGHMAVGVLMECSNSGTYYKLNDECYYYVETTSNGWSAGEIPDKYRYTSANLIKIPSGETINNINPQYIKPCYSSTDFPGYYTDGENFYSDSQCNNLTYCLSYKEFYYNLQAKSFYWDNGCSQIVVKGCAKATAYLGYFTNGVDYYYDSSCTQKARICRIAIYSDRYWDGSNFYWDSGCSQRVVPGCSKSTFYGGYFFDGFYYYSDYQCTQRAKPY